MGFLKGEPAPFLHPLHPSRTSSCSPVASFPAPSPEQPTHNRPRFSETSLFSAPGVYLSVLAGEEEPDINRIICFLCATVAKIPLDYQTHNKRLWPGRKGTQLRMRRRCGVGRVPNRGVRKAFCFCNAHLWTCPRMQVTVLNAPPGKCPGQALVSPHIKNDSRNIKTTLHWLLFVTN